MWQAEWSGRKGAKERKYGEDIFNLPFTYPVPLVTVGNAFLVHKGLKLIFRCRVLISKINKTWEIRHTCMPGGFKFLNKACYRGRPQICINEEKGE